MLSLSKKYDGKMVSLHCRINSQSFLTILSDLIDAMVVELYREGNTNFQDDDALIRIATFETKHVNWAP